MSAQQSEVYVKVFIRKCHKRAMKKMYNDCTFWAETTSEIHDRDMYSFFYASMNFLKNKCVTKHTNCLTCKYIRQDDEWFLKL